MKNLKKYLIDNGNDLAMVNKIIDKFIKLNKIIVEDPSLGEGFAIGHSYFCTKKKIITENDYRKIIKYDIKPILEEYWFDNMDKAEKCINDLLE